MAEKPSITLPGTVEKIIPSPLSPEADMVQINVISADDLYREVRIQNTLIDETGGKVMLKLGSPVAVTITAEAGSTTAVPQKP
jgi:hypothetical protein